MSRYKISGRRLEISGHQNRVRRAGVTENAGPKCRSSFESKR